MLENLLRVRRPGRGSAPEETETWEGLAVLDLYAGTGALGIEALSRGAGWCDFVESNAAARRTIERNLKATGEEQRARVVGAEVEKVIRGSARSILRVPYDVVLLDPPYVDVDLGRILDRLATNELLAPEALVAAEHSRRVGLDQVYRGGDGVGDGQLNVVRERRHGDTVLSIYRFGSPDAGKDENGDDGDLPGEL